jgi:hypothetical protein
MTIPDAVRRGALALALLLIAGCDKQPARFHVAAPGPQTLPAEPATGTHYAHSAWATVHRDSGNTDYVPLRVSTAVEPAWTALDGAALFVGPVIGPEGNLYVPSGRGEGTSHLHAFARDGALLWETPPMRSRADFDHAAVVSARSSTPTATSTPGTRTSCGPSPPRASGAGSPTCRLSA